MKLSRYLSFFISNDVETVGNPKDWLPSFCPSPTSERSHRGHWVDNRGDFVGICPPLTHPHSLPVDFSRDVHALRQNIENSPDAPRLTVFEFQSVVGVAGHGLDENAGV